MLLRILITLLLCACPLALRADTLILANGDKISGEIVEWAVDHVVLEHPQLGRVRLTLDQLEIDTGTPPNPGNPPVVSTLPGSTMRRLVPRDAN